MKILHVIDSGGLYGAEVMLLNLMQEQVALGLQPVLASIGEQGIEEKPLEREARLRGLALRPFRMKPGPNLLGLAEMLRFARGEGAALIHSHGYKGNILFGLLPGRVRGLPLVTTVHGWTWTGGLNRMMAYEWLDGLSLTRMDRVILVNQAMKEHPRLRNRPGLALEVVPNGISAPGQAPVAAADPCGLRIAQFCRQGYTVGAVGRLSQEKGFDLLLEALGLLAADGIELRLVLLGEGGERGALERKAEALGLKERVLMPGYLRDAASYLPLFAQFVMPSLTEGLPMVLLEAMQAGVPIVATRVGGIPDVLQDGAGGLLVEPGSPQALKRAMAEAMTDREAAERRVRSALTRVRDQFSSRAMAEKYSDIYRSVLLDHQQGRNGKWT